MPPVQIPSRAGIVQSISGERHIPSSIRTDGTKRKEIKIRPGFQPIEDVEVYKNRPAEIWKSRGSNGIPGASEVKDGISKDIVVNKNSKKRAAKNKLKQSAQERDEADHEVLEEEIDTETTRKVIEVDTEVIRQKKARNLRKKLKQARELEDKRDKGSVLLPEQLAKVTKINELIRELDILDLQSRAGENEDSEFKS